MSQPITTVRPPQWPLKLMRALVKEEFIEEIEGDMEEIFLNNVEELSLKEAKRKYVWDTLKLCRPVLLRNFKPVPTFNQHAMYRNYFKVAYRNLLKKKAYSFINISGLGLGIACCILIFMYVTDELSYDKYHEKGARIYRLTHGEAAKDGTTPYPFWVWGNAPVGPALKNDFAEVDKIVQFSGRSDILLTYGDRMFQEDGVFFMDSTVFDVFTWKLLKGNPKTALADPFSIVLTETTARKYFGNEDPIGKTLKGSESAGRSNAGDYTVTGVMEDVPANSHFKFNALLSLNTFRQSNPGIFNEWGYVDIYTYFLVNDHFDEAAFTKKLPDFVQHYIKNPEWRYTVKIEPLKDAYLRTTAERQPGETGSLSNIYIFSIIGLFILVIAVINFMNLSTARSLERSKEVGVRKSIGADRKSLVSQFLGESLIIVGLSAVVAIAIVIIALPYMVAFTGKSLELQNFVNVQTITLFLAAMMVIGLLAGSYPAMVLSGFNPVLILKGVSRINSGGGTNLRQALVVFQFSLSIALIAGTMIVYTQMNHLLDKDLGFDNEQMLVVDYNYDQAVNEKCELLKTELEKDPSVVSVAFSRSVPGSYFPHAGTQIETPDGEMKMMGQPVFQVGLDFVTHFGLKLVAGRAYSREYPSDSTQALVINEAAARQFGYQNPADAVGKKFDQWGRKGVVIGVVKDFNFTSLHRTIEPLTLPFDAYSSRYLSVKVKAGNLDQTIRNIGEVWQQTAPHRPFLYSFLNEDFNRQYKADFIFRRLFTTFACLAIFIACLGLLGLATYTAQQRTKEIGIRKVLGADVRSIIGLLSRDFIKLVLIAVLIATPVAWYGMNKWLEGFAYRMELSPWIFVASGCIALAIAVFTISFQSIKAALVNPVSSLKSE